MKGYCIYYEISADYEVSWLEELIAVVDIFVLFSFQKFTIRDTWIPYWGFEYLDGVIVQEIGQNEASVNIFWLIGVESDDKSQVDLVINPFKKIFFWGLRY